MVIVLVAHAAVTPAGKPVAVPIPVAPVVATVILVKAVLIHKVGELDAVAAVLTFTVKVSVPVPVTPFIVTATVPVVPVPITATICEAVFVVIEVTAVPPIFTLAAVAPAKFVPFIVIEDPAQPEELPKLVIVGTGVALTLILSNSKLSPKLE